jgi:phospholipase C
VKFGQSNLGPDDDGVPFVGDLLSAFDYGRLAGSVAPLPRSYAALPDRTFEALPPFHNEGCAAIGIVPDDVARGIHNPIPSDFNPRPSTDPTVAVPAARRLIRRAVR